MTWKFVLPLIFTALNLAIVVFCFTSVLLNIGSPKRQQRMLFIALAAIVLLSVGMVAFTLYG